MAEKRAPKTNSRVAASCRCRFSVCCCLEELREPLPLPSGGPFFGLSLPGTAGRLCRCHFLYHSFLGGWPPVRSPVSGSGHALGETEPDLLLFTSYAACPADGYQVCCVLPFSKSAIAKPAVPPTPSHIERRRRNPKGQESPPAAEHSQKSSVRRQGENPSARPDFYLSQKFARRLPEMCS